MASGYGGGDTSSDVPNTGTFVFTSRDTDSTGTGGTGGTGRSDRTHDLRHVLEMEELKSAQKQNSRPPPARGKSFLKYLPHTMYNFTMKPHHRAPDGSVRLVRVGVGEWYTAAFHVATTIATPAAFAPLPFAVAALGWAGGGVMLVGSTLLAWYCSILVASLWEFDGKQYISYRELMHAIFGRWGFRVTVFFQQVASIGNNIAIQIAAGISMKAIYTVFHKDHNFNLQEFIVLFGMAQLVLSQLPDIYSLRFVNLVCMCCTVGFAAISTAMSIHNGKMIDRSSVDYDLHGSTPTKVFGMFSALGTVAFSFGDAMLPEIQATIKEPTRRNMYKGVSLAYTIIVISYWSVAFAGYWAFGTGVQPYLLSSLSTPTWPIVMANIFAVLQMIGCYQIYCRPTYEYFLIKLMDPDQGPYAARNGLGRLFVTAMYIILVTLVSAAAPFFGDFVSLCGALGFTPLDFVLPALAFLVVKRPKNIFFFTFNLGIAVAYSAVAILGSVGAVRFIATDVTTYKFFKDL